MSMHKPLEGLLRPPLEWYSAAIAMLMGLLLLFYPSTFLLPKAIAQTSTTLLFIFGLWRFKQGYRVFHYVQHLKHRPHYSMTSKQIPVVKNQLFLGKGFLWTTQHTQRLRDLDLDYNLHYKYPSHNFKTLRETLTTWLSKNLPWHSFQYSPDLGGEPCIHGVSEKEENISMQLADRASHIVVVGQPGVGKTRFAELLISQDIKRGDVVIVIDPKGDADLLKRIYIEAKLANREQDLLIFHLGFPHISARYNPVGNFTRVTEVANRISNQLPSSGDSAAFKDFGWQFINSMAMALVSMGEKPDYAKMKFYITKMDILLEKYLHFWLPSIDKDITQWVKNYLNKNYNVEKPVSRLDAMVAYIQTHKLTHNPIFDDLYHACKYDKEYFSKITASLGPLLKKLTTGQVAELLSPHYNNIADEREMIDWLQVIRNQQIVYVGLDALTDREVSTAVGNAMFADLVSVAGRLYKHGLYDGFYKTAIQQQNLPRICLHADEFNEIIGDEFIPLLNKGRGAGFTATVYTQTWSDVEARLKAAAKAGQVAGNLGTVVMFRCKEAKTVEMFLEQLPKVPIIRPIPASSSSDTPGDEGIFYHSSNEDRFTHIEQRLLEQTDILNLPKGQAFALVAGGRPYKLRMPLPQIESVPIPSSIEDMAHHMTQFKINTNAIAT